MGLLSGTSLVRNCFFFLSFGNFEKRGNGRKITEMIFATSVIAVLMSLALADGRMCYLSDGWTAQRGTQEDIGDAYCWKLTQNTTANMAWVGRQTKNVRMDNSFKFYMRELRRSMGRFVCKNEVEAPRRVVRVCVMICDRDLCNNLNARPNFNVEKEQKAKNTANSFASVNKST